MYSWLSQFTKTDKLWGWEYFVVNEPEYCSKFLYIRAGYRTSLHCHKTKKETLVALSGEAVIEFDGRKTTMRLFTVLPCQIHRITAITDTLIIETSTHENGDVVRLEIGGKL